MIALIKRVSVGSWTKRRCVLSVTELRERFHIRQDSGTILWLGILPQPTVASETQAQVKVNMGYRSIQHPNLVSTVSCFLEPGHTGLVVVVWFSQVLNNGSFANYWNEQLFRVLQKIWGEASKKIMLAFFQISNKAHWYSSLQTVPSCPPKQKTHLPSYIYASVLDGNVVEWQYENTCLV